MIKSIALSMLFSASCCLAAQEGAGVVDGSIKKIDAGTKTVVVKAADGTEHTFRYSGDLAVHGGKDVAKGTGDALHGLKEGSDVAVHYSAAGGKETAHEIDKIGDDGLKATKGTVSHMDKAAHKISIKTADGTEETFQMTGRAAKDTGKDVADAADKSGRVTVYYTEEAGKKTAHFIKAL
jgi:Cu/Ag efflux protein CusF